VIIKPVAEPSTRVRALQNDQADVTVDVAPDQAAVVDKSERLAIMLTVLGINLIGDWLRDYLDDVARRGVAGESHPRSVSGDQAELSVGRFGASRICCWSSCGRRPTFAALGDFLALPLSLPRDRSPMGSPSSDCIMIRSAFALPGPVRLQLPEPGAECRGRARLSRCGSQRAAARLSAPIPASSATSRRLLAATQVSRHAGLETAQLAVLLGKALPFLRHGALMENGVDRAFRLAGATFDALVRIYVVHVLGLVYARDWANVYAAGVFFADARLNDDVCHAGSPRTGSVPHTAQTGL
jgi:hypothetical protein